MNLGIDFGSTYSMLSYYDAKKDVVRSVQSQHGSNYIPSIACLDHAGKLITGQAAKNMVAQSPGKIAYRAFKMLLTESDKDRLTQMHYDDTYTPRMIAKEFLRDQMLLATKRCKTKKFDKVVICIPQVWNSNIYTMSGKAILKDICMELKEEMDILDKVTVVSEPAAASAYFAYSYQRETQAPFNGRMLIVDYGGGTLDISLTNVSTMTREDGTTAMEIDVLGETGAGENHGNQIGDAGIAYQEGTVRMALQEAGFLDVPNDAEFFQNVCLFESELIDKTDQIQEKVRIEKAGKVARLKNDYEVFTTLLYRGQTVDLTYSTIYRAYTQIIQPVLAEQLEKVREEYLDPTRNTPDSEDGTGYVNELKFALVGGFGQFELVRQQVYDFFGIHREEQGSSENGTDENQEEDGGREDAICYGAALIADGLISLKKTAKLSMGLAYRIHDTDTFHFAITKQMNLQYGEVYYMPDPIFFGGTYSDANENTWEFAIGRGNRLDKAYRLIPLPKVRNELNKIAGERLYYFGFSVDDSDIYTFHVTPAEDIGILIESQAKKIRLGNFSDVFGSKIIYQESDAIYLTPNC